MTRLITFVAIGIMIFAFSGCTVTPGDSLQAEIAKFRAEQEADVDALEWDMHVKNFNRNFFNDLKRHNWIEWPIALTLQGLELVSTGHQARDFRKLHKDFDRYFFNAPWNDPYLVD